MPLKHNKDTISLENSLSFVIAAGHTLLKKLYVLTWNKNISAVMIWKIAIQTKTEIRFHLAGLSQTFPLLPD